MIELFKIYEHTQKENEVIVLKQKRFCIIKFDFSIPIKTIYKRISIEK